MAISVGDQVRIINDGHTIWGGLVGVVKGKDSNANEWLILLNGGQNIIVGEPEERLVKLVASTPAPAPAPKAREIDLTPAANASAYLAKAFGW